MRLSGMKSHTLSLVRTGLVGLGLVILSLLATGCNTMVGVGKDLQFVGEGLADVSDND